jgi:hypothetical protein
VLHGVRNKRARSFVRHEVAFLAGNQSALRPSVSDGLPKRENRNQQSLGYLHLKRGALIRITP